MDWSSWGSSWLGSWGSSWGPLHEVYDPYDPLKDPWAQGAAGKKEPQRDYLSENLIRQQEARDRRAQAEYNLTRLHQDDQDAVEFIMALLNTELLDG